jgi:hypothetical protein
MLQGQKLINFICHLRMLQKEGRKVMTIASIRDISNYSPLIVCSEGLRLKAKLSTLITLTPHC